MKKYKANIILRLILIFLSFSLLYYLLQYTSLLMSLFGIAVLIIIQIYLLFKYIDLQNRLISRFFESIKFSDYSQSFSKNPYGESFQELTEEFDRVQNIFKETRLAKEEQFHFFQTMLQNTNVGIVAYKDSGEVEFINNSAKKLLKIQFLKNINSLVDSGIETSKNLLKLKLGDKFTIKQIDQNEIVRLAVQVSKFNTQYNNYTLLSIQNIQMELNQKEIESWQKLIKVLTHEIMNSITPISSLASSLSNLFSKSDNESNLSLENIEDTRGGLDIIKRRSDGLLNFVEKYRSLTKIPQPKLESFAIESLFERIKKLLCSEFESRGIEFSTNVVPPPLKLTADPELIEQLLLNLIYNAIRALTNTMDPSITISASLSNNGRVEIKVIDNGPGISDAVKEQIFVPFYTTKEDGSGIGLSLSKQIMHLHGGDITVTSDKNNETIFYLLF